MPLEVVVIYWVYQCYRGNKQAFSLLIALATESLERRFDDAFGVIRTEQERNDITTARIKALESDLANLGEGFAIDDDVRRERDFLSHCLNKMGSIFMGCQLAIATKIKEISSSNCFIDFCCYK